MVEVSDSSVNTPSPIFDSSESGPPSSKTAKKVTTMRLNPGSMGTSEAVRVTSVLTPKKRHGIFEQQWKIKGPTSFCSDIPQCAVFTTTLQYAIDALPCYRYAGNQNAPHETSQYTHGTKICIPNINSLSIIIIIEHGSVLLSFGMTATRVL